MGLCCSHNAFRGAYSAFNSLRQAICHAIGPEASFPPHWQYTETGGLAEDEAGRVLYRNDLDPGLIYLPSGLTVSKPGLCEFLTHSDCDGEISPEMCAKVADDLEEILPNLEAMNWQNGGHIGAQGGYVEVVKKFIAGCRAAAAANEPLEFY
jgi:hypothetical protein